MKYESNIVFDYITRYINDSLAPKGALLLEMEQFAAENSVPIITPDVAALLQALIIISGAKNILEIGTAIGYSAAVMLLCAGEGAQVATIEKDPKMIEMSTQYMKNFNVTILEGDAAEVLAGLDSEYDFIFMDAAKSQYLDMLPHCLRLLKTGGVLVSDNVLYKGMVATDELRERRKITIIKRLRKYIETICNHEALHTSIVPIGDGISISVKK